MKKLIMICVVGMLFANVRNIIPENAAKGPQVIKHTNGRNIIPGNIPKGAKIDKQVLTIIWEKAMEAKNVYHEIRTPTQRAISNLWCPNRVRCSTRRRLK